MLVDNYPCLLSLATEEDVVGTLATDFLEKVKQADTVTLVSMEGRHNVLPNRDFIGKVQIFLVDGLLDEGLQVTSALAKSTTKGGPNFE
jgi:hypothetical protein